MKSVIFGESASPQSVILTAAAPSQDSAAAPYSIPCPTEISASNVI